MNTNASSVKESLTSVQIFDDTTFQTGFIVKGKEHEDGNVGKLFPSQSKIAHPAWYMAQWACNHNIVNGKKTQLADGYIYETDSQRVEVSTNPSKPNITLELKASKEYTAPRISGQEWPHLLIEQENLQTKCPTLDKVKALDFTISAKIAYCTCKMSNPNPDLHAAQVNMFFTVQNLLTGDMYWFGIPFYDNRYEIQPEYMAVDGGKSDASNKFIYIAAQKEFTDKSLNNGDWVQYSKDIYPFIIKGLQEAKKQGYLENDNPKEYTLTTMNLGWEMPGTYDGSLEIKNLSLNATVTQKVSD